MTRILGKFRKGIPGSYSLNFGLPGGKYCSSLCPYKERICYGLKLSKMYLSAHIGWKNLENMGGYEVLCRAIKEVKYRIKNNTGGITWFRFNVVGSLPHANQRGQRFDKKLIELVRILQKNSIPTHLPVETINKQRFYSKLFRQHKIQQVVRLSCQTKREWLNFNGPCSFLAGSIGDTAQVRLNKAKQLRINRRLKFPKRQVIVCPAILTNKLLFPQSKGRIKCGQCQACSRKNIDVIYILH